MRRKRELGYCLVTNELGAAWELPIEEYERVRTAWLKGTTHVDTFGFHGDAMTLRLVNVDSISKLTADVVASALDERRADEADDSLTTS